MYSLSSPLSICCSCQQPIIPHDISPHAESLLASREITVLACGHGWHSLCIERMYQGNDKTPEEKNKFLCSVHKCNQKPDVSFIQKNLPTAHRLINPPTPFAQIYVQPYFSSPFAMEAYISQHTSQQQNTSDTQLQTQELANNTYPHLSSSCVCPPDQAFFLLLKTMVDAQENSPLHQALSQGHEEEALKIAHAMNITQLKSHYQEIDALMTPEDILPLFDIVISLDEPSGNFLLAYWLLNEKIKANPQNEVAKKLQQAMKRLLS